MQEEVTQKTIALVIKTAKLDANVLKAAMRMYLNHRRQKAQKTHGKTSVKKLVGEGVGVSSIEVTDGNIKSFERVARKYNVDFAVKKDKTTDPPKYVVFFKGRDAKKFRQGVEYGSARWGNAKDIEPYMDYSVFENNVLLTQTERLMMSGRPKEPKYARNKNILVIGGSGSGKTRFFVKPNLMQMHSSYVVTDPKGTVLVECGKMLKRGKYKIKVLNTINFAKSMHYNPFAYIRSEKDILKLVNTIIVNTKGEGQQSGEDFWVKAEKLYYTALIAYIWYEAPEDEQNFANKLFLQVASD